MTEAAPPAGNQLRLFEQVEESYGLLLPEPVLADAVAPPFQPAGEDAAEPGLFDWPSPDASEQVPDLAAEVVSSQPVETPRLASFARRFAAGAVDLVAIVACFFVAMVALPPFRRWVEASSSDTTMLFQVNMALSVLVYVFYMLCLAPPGDGRTPGYRLLRLRLVGQDTQTPPSWLQGFLWCIGSVALAVGWIFYWFDPRRRMLHNIISKTIVIETGVPLPLTGRDQAVARLKGESA